MSFTWKGFFQSTVQWYLKALQRYTNLVYNAGAAVLPLDPGPEPAQLHVLTVHQQAALGQPPGLTELLLSVVLQGHTQEALGQAGPSQPGLHTQQSLAPVELQGPAEVVQGGPLVGAQHQAAASLTQVVCPDVRLFWGSGDCSVGGVTVAPDDPVQVGHSPFMQVELGEASGPLAQELQSKLCRGSHSHGQKGQGLLPMATR